MRWPWTRSPEVRESYTDVIQTALYDHVLGGGGKPPPQETSAVLASCRLWSATTSMFAVTPANPLAAVLATLGWKLAMYGWFGARLEGGELFTVDRYRKLPGGWFATETTRDERTARTVVAPGDFLLVELPGKRAPWRTSGATALAALDRALAVDAGKPVGLALGSGLEGALDLSAVTQTLTDAWRTNFKQGSVIVSDGKPVAVHTGPSPQLLTGAANLRPDLVGSVLDSFGVPRSLFLASGAGSREALRLFTAVTGSWLASLTERAARRVLGETLTITATRSNAPADAVSPEPARSIASPRPVSRRSEALRLAGLQ